jgi:hypothetical protein
VLDRILGAREDDHPQLGIERVHALEGLEAAEPRHREIEDDHVGALVLELPQPLEAVRRLQHLEPEVTELLGQDHAQILFVVDDQDFHGRLLQ